MSEIPCILQEDKEPLGWELRFCILNLGFLPVFFIDVISVFSSASQIFSNELLFTKSENDANGYF